MSMPVNCETFDQMVDEDIEWLRKKIPPDERGIMLGHIEGCLEMAKKYYREVDIPSRPDSDWDC